MKPPPPRLPAAGYVTASAKATATAASTALPPRRMTSTPTREAIGLVEATIPRGARTGSREAKAGRAVALARAFGPDTSGAQTRTDASSHATSCRLKFINSHLFGRRDFLS